MSRRDDPKSSDSQSSEDDTRRTGLHDDKKRSVLSMVKNGLAQSFSRMPILRRRERNKRSESLRSGLSATAAPGSGDALTSDHHGAHSPSTPPPTALGRGASPRKKALGSPLLRNALTPNVTRRHRHHAHAHAQQHHRASGPSPVRLEQRAMSSQVLPSRPHTSRMTNTTTTSSQPPSADTSPSLMTSLASLSPSTAPAPAFSAAAMRKASTGAGRSIHLQRDVASHNVFSTALRDSMTSQDSESLVPIKSSKEWLEEASGMVTELTNTLKHGCERMDRVLSHLQHMEHLRQECETACSETAELMEDTLEQELAAWKDGVHALVQTARGSQQRGVPSAKDLDDLHALDTEVAALEERTRDLTAYKGWDTVENLFWLLVLAGILFMALRRIGVI